MIANVVATLQFNLKLLIAKRTLKIIVANVLDVRVVPLFKNLDDNYNIADSAMRTDFSSFIKNGIITNKFIIIPN